MDNRMINLAFLRKEHGLNLRTWFSIYFDLKRIVGVKRSTGFIWLSLVNTVINLPLLGGEYLY
jgi:hypothetical protein